MDMDQRKQELLKVIITEYIKTAVPVSSKFIADSGLFKLSPATIRNEMAELEEQGYIDHPHTSAGRVPSERGYEFFVGNFLEDKPLTKKQTEEIKLILKAFKDVHSQAIKQVARQISEFSNNAVFVAFSKNDFYYTGISNLFAQPEFYEPQKVYNVSKVIDHFDKVVSNVFDVTDEQVKILVGKNNPFSADCSTVMTKFNIKKDQGIFGILGPMRMDYQNNFNLVKFSQELISKI